MDELEELRHRIKETQGAFTRRRRRTKLESWVEESEQRGEDMKVIIRNETTGEEVETNINPSFLASIITLK